MSRICWKICKAYAGRSDGGGQEANTGSWGIDNHPIHQNQNSLVNIQRYPQYSSGKTQYPLRGL